MNIIINSKLGIDVERLPDNDEELEILTKNISLTQKEVAEIMMAARGYEIDIENKEMIKNIQRKIAYRIFLITLGVLKKFVFSEEADNLFEEISRECNNNTEMKRVTIKKLKERYRVIN